MTVVSYIDIGEQLPASSLLSEGCELARAAAFK